MYNLSSCVVQSVELVVAAVVPEPRSGRAEFRVILVCVVIVLVVVNLQTTIIYDDGCVIAGHAAT